MSNDKENHDSLLMLIVKVDNLENLLSNHLRHHWAITLSLIGITGTASISVLILIIRLLSKI